MFAVQFDRLGPPEVLFTGPFPEPHPGRGEVRIAVRAAGVSPVDVAIRAGRSLSGGQVALPHIPGVDAAGVVDEVGAGVTGVAIGDEVFGAVDVARLGGASAQFAVLAFWAARPGSMSWEQAGAAGTSIETATRVIGTGSAENQAFLTGLGAVPVTYGPGLASRIRAVHDGLVDRALDVAGAGSLAELIAITGAAASVVTIADFTGPQAGVRLSTGDLGGEPNGRQGLAVAAALFGQGRFHVPLRAAFPIAQAAQAHALAARGPRRGKIVLTVPAGPKDRRHTG